MDAWAIDLAPHHKSGLPLRTRVLIAAGISRLAHPSQIPYRWDGVGAVITGPWSGLAGHPAYPVLKTRPGGVLWVPPRPPGNTNATLRRMSAHWPRQEIAILAALGPGDVAETREGARRLARCAQIAGLVVEIGADEGVGQAVARVDVAGETLLPVIAAVPLHREDLIEPLVHAGIQALIVAMPPEGVWRHRGRAVTGRLYGPLLLPLTLAALRRTRARAPQVPIIAQGGIHAATDAIRCLEEGADAVALDAAVWVEPDLPAHVHRAILAWETQQADEISSASSQM
ncbi:MAG: hypothetical protein GXO55_05795 [Chloroflexi bacterium]|nr:hypothetical protein [Chloroflexota bacterium]